MLGEGIIEDIKSLAATGLDVRNIAAALGLEDGEVKDALGKTEKALVAPEVKGLVAVEYKANDRIVSEDEHEEVIETILGIARYSENDNAKLKACQWIHEEKIGRNKEKHDAMINRSVRGGGDLGGGGNVFIQIQEAKERAAKIKEKAMSGEVIELVEEGEA